MIGKFFKRKNKFEVSWVEWEDFARNYKFTYELNGNGFKTPVLKGEYKTRPFSVEIEAKKRPGSKDKINLNTSIKTYIANPLNIFLLIQYRDVFNQKSLHYNNLFFPSEDKEFNQNFEVKSNTERIPFLILKEEKVIGILKNRTNYLLEIENYQFTLKYFNEIKEERDILLLFELANSFLLEFNRISEENKF